MIEIDDLSLNEWYACLKPYQKVVIEQLVSKYGEEKAAEEWQALKEKEAAARQRKKEREEERMAADPEYAAMMAERKAEYTRTRTAKRKAEREALVELAKTDEEAAKKLAEMRKYQSEATVRSYQKMKADAEAGDPDAIKRYETTLAKRREEYHRKKGA
jgi:site-specific DNA recombinase